MFQTGRATLFPKVMLATLVILSLAACSPVESEVGQEPAAPTAPSEADIIRNRLETLALSTGDAISLEGYQARDSSAVERAAKAVISFIGDKNCTLRVSRIINSYSGTPPTRENRNELVVWPGILEVAVAEADLTKANRDNVHVTYGTAVTLPRPLRDVTGWPQIVDKQDIMPALLEADNYTEPRTNMLGTISFFVPEEDVETAVQNLRALVQLCNLE